MPDFKKQSEERKNRKREYMKEYMREYYAKNNEKLKRYAKKSYYINKIGLQESIAEKIIAILQSKHELSQLAS